MSRRRRDRGGRLLVLLPALAACATDGASARPAAIAPPVVAVRPLAVRDLRAPYQGLVLAAGGSGHAATVRLADRIRRQPLAAGMWIEVSLAAGSSQRSSRPISVRPSWARQLAQAELAVMGVLAIAPAELVVRVRHDRGGDAEAPGAAHLAVAILAALVGEPMDRTTAVVADLAPDGTLVSAADAEEDVSRALRRGLRRIVLPMGEAPTQLSRRVEAAGGSVSLAGDLSQAFRIATGRHLPVAVPLRPQDMRLTADETAELGVAYRRWLVRLAAVWPDVVALGNRARLAPPVLSLALAGARAARNAEDLRRAAELPAAEAVLARAVLHAELAVRIDRILRDDGASARTAVTLRGDPVAPAEPPAIADGALGDRLRGLLVARDHARARALASDAAALERAATKRIAEVVDRRGGAIAMPAELDGLGALVAPFLIASARARHAVEAVAARRALDRGGPDLDLSARQVGELLRRLRTTAEGPAGPRGARDRWTGEPAAHPVRHSEVRALRLADRAARRWAARARTATGIVPAGARASYAAAVTLAGRGAVERVMALELYRAASAECRVAVLLSLTVASR